MTTITREEALAHFGVAGMRWGVRRDPKTGIRPIAQTLNDSKFGQKSIQRAEAYATRKESKAGADPTTTIYAVYAASLLTMYGGLKVAQFFDSGNAKVLVNKGKRAVTFNTNGPQYKKNPALAKKNMSEDQLMNSWSSRLIRTLVNLEPR